MGKKVNASEAGSRSLCFLGGPFKEEIAEGLEVKCTQ